MSARKSFDVRPKRTTKKRKPARKEARTRSPKQTLTLRERRARVRQAQGMGVLVAAIVLTAGVVYLFWRPEVRITEVKASDPAFEASLEEIARTKMEGTRGVVFPRDSFFFYPEREIEEAILQAHPELQKVSVSRMNFTALQVSFETRGTAFWWCGEPTFDATQSTDCFEADGHGFIFKRAVGEVATGTPLVVYAKLDTASTTDTYPLRARVLGTERIPDILRFSKTIESLGTPLRSIAIREDEADIYTEGGTRITYVIGKENEAAKSAEAALPTLNLMDGSVLYVDLRFPNKAYIQKRGEE